MLFVLLISFWLMCLWVVVWVTEGCWGGFRVLIILGVDLDWVLGVVVFCWFCFWNLFGCLEFVNCFGVWVCRLVVLGLH